MRKDSLLLLVLNTLVVLYLSACSGGTASLPVAVAGADQDVATAVLVSLDGSGSSDPEGDPLTYTWTQVYGPDVTGGLGTLSGINPSFTSPTGVSTVVFSLVVSDGSNTSSSDLVQINVMEDPANALFVDGDNGSDGSGTGSRAAPFASVLHALTQANAVIGIRPDIYVMSRTGGTSYSPLSVLQVQSGVSLYGGFDANWRRNVSGNKTRIVGIASGFYFFQVNQNAWLSGFDFTASAPSLGDTLLFAVYVYQGTAQLTIDNNTITTENMPTAPVSFTASNYGIWVNNLRDLVIRNNTVTTGNSANGANGPVASDGANGNNDAVAGDAGVDGGAGGLGGTNDGNSALNGFAGGAGSAGGSGLNGSTGSGSSPGTGGTYAGGNGGIGGTGAAGASQGADSANPGNGVGSVVAGAFMSSFGGTGSQGDDGTPGSGGGGGAGDTGSGTGGGGGGGGAAGGGGQGGIGGIGGGASIGIFIYNVTNLNSMTGNTVTAGNGGNAGAGANGGLGGSGGTGSGGGTGEGSAGTGGIGGNGGDGRDGGDGAGGGGGPSYALLLDTLGTFSITGNTLTAGNGGTGGNSRNGYGGGGGHSYAVYIDNIPPGTGPGLDAANSLTGGTGGSGGTATGSGTSGGAGFNGPYLEF